MQKKHVIDRFYHQNLKSEIVKAAQVLEHAAKYVLAIEKIATESGEGVKFKTSLKLFNYCSNHTDLMKFNYCSNHTDLMK
jgi:hypothetical protein